METIEKLIASRRAWAEAKINVSLDIRDYFERILTEYGQTRDRGILLRFPPRRLRQRVLDTGKDGTLFSGEEDPAKSTEHFLESASSRLGAWSGYVITKSSVLKEIVVAMPRGVALTSRHELNDEDWLRFGEVLTDIQEKFPIT